MLTLKIAARGSALSIAQTKQTLVQLKETFPDLDFELKPYKTAGDTDKTTSLTDSSIPDNFFSDTLDKAVLSGEVDAAIHSSKDLPLYENSDIAWFYLPWQEDPSDCIILRKDGSLPNSPKIGVSSDNRENYAKTKWPNGICTSIRGDIEHRITMLDNHEVDILILATAGLKRLGYANRITEKVPTSILPTHPSQGKLAITFHKNNKHLLMIRNILLPTVNICGAGTGKDGNYTHAVSSALEQADLCLKDSLMDEEILQHCSGTIENVGKRYNDAAEGIQNGIHQKMINAICRGEKVVRLKGGDPALFGRLTEELHFLNKHQLSWKVHPGIPWFCSATLKHGIMITSRKQTRNFTVATGTEIEGKTFDSSSIKSLSGGSIYFYMATRKIEAITKNLIENGMSSDTSVALFKEESGDNNIVRGTLSNIQEKFEFSKITPPALLLVGSAADENHCYIKSEGALSGLRILISGTNLTRKIMDTEISKLGGTPVHLPLFQLTPSKTPWINDLKNTDWIILASGSASEIFIEELKSHQFDLRECPKIATTGPSASNVLKKHGIFVDYQSKVFTSKALATELIDSGLIKDKTVMVLKSSLSVSPLSKRIEASAKSVQAHNLYENTPVKQNGELPLFDIATFCSPSAFHAFHQHFPDGLKNKLVSSIGPVTTEAISKSKIDVNIEPKTYTATHLIRAIASNHLWAK